MNLCFLGACNEVGKSCFWLQAGEVRLFLDVGIRIHDGNLAPNLEQHQADAAVITHAHMDHSGALPAPVCGSKQLEASFANKGEASGYSLALSARDQETEGNETAGKASDPAAGVEWIWQNETLHEAEPGENDLPAEQAYAIAVQALIEDFGMDADEITANTATLEENFLLRENGSGVWDIYIYLILDGVDYDCSVWLDGATGEVLTIDVGTGGNG